MKEDHKRCLRVQGEEKKCQNNRVASRINQKHDF